jgi:hypothetical protein
MSLYRQVGRPSGWLAAAVLGALVVGFVIGFAASRATADEPTFADAVEELQADAGPTADALELVAIHYEASKDAARGQLERARESFAELEPELRLLSPEDTAAAATAIERVATLVEQGAPAAEVEAAADDARAAVRRAARVR